MEAEESIRFRSTMLPILMGLSSALYFSSIVLSFPRSAECFNHAHGNSLGYYGVSFIIA